MHELGDGLDTEPHGSGTWTVELWECARQRGEAGKAMQVYPSASAAREAADIIYRRGGFLAPLPTWDEQRREEGRWRIRVREPAP